MRLRAVLSRTTTASAFSVKRFKVKIELYGCTTTSGESSQLGKTEYVYCLGQIEIKDERSVVQGSIHVNRELFKAIHT